MRGATELGCIGTLNGTRTRLVTSCTVYIILILDGMGTLRQTIEIIVGSVVLRCAIRPTMPAAELSDRLQTGSTFVLHLNKVVVAVGGDGDTHPDTVAHFQLTIDS